MNVLALDDRRLRLGVRPEDIRVVAAPEPGAVEALVRSIEYLGADSIMMCAIGTQALAVRAPRRVALPGARVYLASPRAPAHLFPPQTPRRPSHTPPHP